MNCNDECEKILRNKKLAAALQIQNADVFGAFDGPMFNEFLKEQYEKEPSFMLKVERSFCDLLNSLNASNQTQKCHTFPPMSRDLRRIVHEYADYFHMETQSFDPDPKRNVQVIAKKGQATRPAKLLSEVMPKQPVKVLQTKVAPPPANGGSANAWIKNRSNLMSDGAGN